MWKILISALDSHQFHIAFALQKKLRQHRFMENKCKTDQNEHKFVSYQDTVIDQQKTHSVLSLGKKM